MHLPLAEQPNSRPSPKPAHGRSLTSPHPRLTTGLPALVDPIWRLLLAPHHNRLLLWPVKRAELVAVGVTYIGQVHRTEAAVPEAGRLLY